MGFTQQQIEQLIGLLNNQVGSETTSHAAFLVGKSFSLFSNGNNSFQILDSGASDHITPHLSLFTTYNPISKPIHITLPNGKAA